MQAANNIVRILKSKGAYSVFLRGIAVISAFGTQLLIARFLSVAEFGVYACAFSTVQLFAIFSRGGFDTAACQYISIYHHTNNLTKLAGFIRTMIITALALAFTGAAAQTGVILLWGTSSSVLLASALLLPLQSSGVMLDTTIRSFGSSIKGLISPIIANLSFLLLIGTAKALGHTPNTAAQCILLQALAFVPSIILGLYYVKGLLPKDFRWSEAEYSFREWAYTSVPMLCFALLVYFQSRLGPIVANALFGNESAALVAAAERLAILTTFGLQSLNQVTASEYAVLFHSKSHDQLQKVVTRSARFGLAFALIVSLAIGAFGGALLSLFGEGFILAYECLFVLTLGSTVSAITGPVHYLLTMTGRTWTSVLLVLSATIASALILILLRALSIDLISVPIAIASGTAFSNISAMLIVHKQMRIWSLPFRITSPQIFTLKGAR